MAEDYQKTVVCPLLLVTGTQSGATLGASQ
jgi:hypothetical protein